MITCSRHRTAAPPGRPGTGTSGGVGFVSLDSMSAVEDFLPEQTSDDTDLGWGDWREADPDAFYLDNRPPHWG